ncbi:hypothetical protein OH687_37800 [Burkholderia anthina]|nr:hypothetical protein OH687_37800 [Burkholderia anthina]
MGEVAETRIRHGRIRRIFRLGCLLSKVISIAESVGLSLRVALID